MSDFTIKVGDTRPTIEVQLLDEDDDPRDLTSVDSVTFSMKHVENNTVIIDEQSATIEDAENGVVSYTWQTGDTDTEGEHAAEFEVNYTNGGIETFPNYGNIDVYVADQVSN